jgi:hypothetical protein
MQAMLGSLVGALGVKDLDPKKLENAKAEYSVRVETDWPEIRPHWVTTEKRISVEVEGKTAERIETHEYRFDWSAAKPVTCPVPTRNAGAR